MNENIKCGYSFSKLGRKEQYGTKIICVFIFFFHFHRLPCELENAHVLYKIKRKFAFFGEYQICFISWVENDVLNSLDEIYLVFASK